MRTPAADRVRCALIVQRLMDADLLLPEEGNALLEEIDAWNPPTDSPDAQTTHADRFIRVLEAVTQTDRLDAAARQEALETARAFLHPPTDPTAPSAQSDTPRA